MAKKKKICKASVSLKIARHLAGNLILPPHESREVIELGGTLIVLKGVFLHNSKAEATRYWGDFKKTHSSEGSVFFS